MTLARYFVSASESTAAPTPVEIETLGAGRFAVTLAGVRHEVDAQASEGDNLSMLIDGASYWAEIEPAPSANLAVGTSPLTPTRIRLRRQSFAFEVMDERRHRLRQAAPVVTLEGRQIVRSPMPGKVVKLLVSKGDLVKMGQGLVVVEAMKMENELRSPKDGRVVEIQVAEGAAVESQAALLVVE